MSDPIAVIRGRVRELELEAVAIKARHQEATELLAQLEYGERRRGRHRKITVINMPERVEGGMAVAEAEPEDAA